MEKPLKFPEKRVVYPLFTMKTNKSYKKRLKVTKNGKVIARRPGQNHFNAKESGDERRDKARSAHLKMTQKSKARFLSNI